MRWTTQTRSPAQTHTLARALAAHAPAGLVVALDGDLGAGKTCFAQGVGAVLVPDAEVLSPTFILVAEHEGPRPLLHADLYRVEDSAALAGIGLEESLEDWPGVALVEWAERFPEVLPADHLHIHIGFGPDDIRILTATAHGPRARTALAAWQAHDGG